uniref:Uncharacterized protein n=1 Tax=Cacopsylla melanoneura TaxID=428564 RepID=A0A8D9ANY2_9HEMI
MIPQPRIHLRRDRTPNRKYIENNLYEIRKRLKQNENTKTNGVNKTIKTLKSSEKSSSSSKKLTSSNGRANFKLAPVDFITNLQRAHESFQRAQNQILDSNQNIVDQLKVHKSSEKDCISAQENDKIKLKMSSNVLSAVGLVPVANT